MKFKEIFTESQKHVYYQEGEIWLSYGQGSGQTIQLPNVKKYLTSDKNDKNYDSLVKDIEKWSDSAKPIKQKSNVKLFEIPVYGRSNMGDKFDIWGGDFKPKDKMYMVVTKDKNTIINFFTNKNEALNWVKSIS